MTKLRFLSFVSIVALLILANHAAAQELGSYRVQSLIIGSGENAVTSGIAGTIRY